MDNKNLKDHRQIGQDLDLFSMHDVAPGAVFWHDKGYTIFKTLVEFIREKLRNEGYQEVFTPVMVKSALFKRSGHWDFYNENMFSLPVYSNEEKQEAREIIEHDIVAGLYTVYEEKRKENPKLTQQEFVKEVKLKNNTIIPVKLILNRGHGDVKATQYTYVLEYLTNYSLKPMNCPGACLVYSTRTRSYQDLP